MAYRRKAPPATQLSFLRQLQMLCNASAMGLPFQVHNACVLYNQTKKQSSALFDQFNRNATRQDFVPSRLIESCGGTIIKGAPSYILPLPKHFMDPCEMIDTIEPRVFYHASMVKSPGCVKKAIRVPRCGLTGMFFTREEIVDNLQAAALDLGFGSPFWIRRDHPSLGDFIHLREGSEAVCLGLTAAVVSINNVEPFPRELLHPLLRKESTGGSDWSSFSLKVPLGMNALSGFNTKNPFVQKMPNRGVWISQEQVIQNGLTLRNGASEDSYVLVEIEQWEMHNADQLSVPGRLALCRSNTIDSETKSVFQ